MDRLGRGDQESPAAEPVVPPARVAVQPRIGVQFGRKHRMLHKTSKVRGYHLHATDGEIGHVDDFLFDEQWRVAYLIIDTSNWLGGRWVLVSTASITKIDSPNKTIYLNLHREQIRSGPHVDSVNIELVETLPSFIIF
jgi:PRC-barrel domain